MTLLASLLHERKREMTTRSPCPRYTAGRDAALILRLVPILYDRTLDRILAANLRRHYPKGVVGRR